MANFLASRISGTVDSNFGTQVGIIGGAASIARGENIQLGARITTVQTQSVQQLQAKISTLENEKKTLQEQKTALENAKKTLQEQKTALETDKKKLQDSNDKLKNRVIKFEQKTTESISEKNLLEKVLTLAFQVDQEADSANTISTKAKTDAADLLKQAESSAAKANTSAPNSREAKAAASAHEKAKTAKTNAVRKATAVQTASGRIKELANNYTTRKTKIDNQSEAKIKEEQTKLKTDMKALTDAIAALENEVKEAAKQAEAAAKQVVTQVKQVAAVGDNWSVIAPLFGFGTSSAGDAAASAAGSGTKPPAGSGANVVDNWSVIQQVFGISHPATSGSVGNKASTKSKTSTTATLTLAQASVRVGSNIQVNFAGGPGNTKDWIGVYPSGQKPGSRGWTLWLYTNGTQTASGTATTGSVTFTKPTLAAGAYEVYFLKDNVEKVLAGPVAITVT